MRPEPVYTIKRQFAFSASHQLDGLLPDHKCSRLHGHTYRVGVELEGTLSSVGFVLDFAELDWVATLLSARLDHRHLNDVVNFNPTSENLAGWISSRVAGRSAELGWSITRISVTVSESPSTSATATVTLA